MVLYLNDRLKEVMRMPVGRGAHMKSQRKQRKASARAGAKDIRRQLQLMKPSEDPRA